MSRVTVVGSGPSGVHFAKTLLEKGIGVTMIDAGRPAPEAGFPDADLDGWKAAVNDPVATLLGERFEGVTLPDEEGEFYGLAPDRIPLFRRPPGEAVEPEGFAPLLSYARGGLAEAWTGGVYPWDDRDLEGWPFGTADLMPRYGEVARRIGVTGADDDLAPFLPVHDHLRPPLDLDGHAERLLARYRRRRSALNGRGVRLGHSRIAVLGEDRDGRRGCGYLGRCLWGCPRGSIWVPSMTLAACRAHPEFEYRDGRYVEAFAYDADRRVRAVVARPLEGGPAEEIAVDALALAAGTISSTRIVLESILRGEGRRPRAEGLMDNRQVLLPFVTPARLGAAREGAAYQYHQLCVGIEPDGDEPYVHGQVTTLTTALVHPVLGRIPTDLRTARALFRYVRGALGVVNVNLHDTRRSGNALWLEEGAGEGDRRPAGGGSTLRIAYAPAPDEPARIRRAVSTIRGALRRLGAHVPPGAVHVRPMGASVHYSGTLPMSERAGPLTTSARGRSHDFANLWIVDGSTFPSLPAKNPTFTLMANAVRIAEEEF